MLSLLRGVAYTLLTLSYIVVVAAAVTTLYPYGEKAVDYVAKEVAKHVNKQPGGKPAVCPCGPPTKCPCPHGTCPSTCPPKEGCEDGCCKPGLTKPPTKVLPVQPNK